MSHIPSTRTPVSSFDLHLPSSSSSSSDSDDACDEQIFDRSFEELQQELQHRRRLLQGIEDDYDEVDNSQSKVAMCIVWAGGKLGISYYDARTAQLFLYPDIAESAPDFLICRSIFLEIEPKYVIISSRQDGKFTSSIRELCGESVHRNPNLHTSRDGNSSFTSDPCGTVNEMDENESNKAQLFILTGKEFAPDHCKARVKGLKLPFGPKGNVEDQQNFIASIIPLSNDAMVRAAGALLRFLDKRSIELFRNDLIDGEVPVVNVALGVTQDLVLLDESAWKSLQVFNLDVHPSCTKAASFGSTREGLSIFSLLNHCHTPMGCRTLRMFLLRPTRNHRTLRRRHDVIEFCSSSENIDTAQSLNSCVKAVKNIQKLLLKLAYLTATVKDWKEIYQTIYHFAMIGQICATSQLAVAELFQDISQIHWTRVLDNLFHDIKRTIDFDGSEQDGRIITNPGLDPELDLKKQQFYSLPDVMALVSAEELALLPPYVEGMQMTFVPEIGYLVGVTRNEELMDFDDRTKELDIVLGDCHVSILEKETKIIFALAQSVLHNADVIVKMGALVGELDALMGLGKVAAERRYIRPNILPPGSALRIRDGRNPLSDVLLDTFVPNSTIFDNEEHLVLLTGPNASGKSVYLRQVASIVLMALTGSFVPASFANIPTFDRIFTRINAVETLSAGLSTFMIDVNQMSLALRMSSSSSLIIVDEFGKGTRDDDGLALLASFLMDFLARDDQCPTIILSTHFYSLADVLVPSPAWKCQKMEFVIIEDTITYTHMLVDGRCTNSFACEIAQTLGFDSSCFSRAKELSSVVGNAYLRINPINSSSEEAELKACSHIAETFLSDFNEDYPEEFQDQLDQMNVDFSSCLTLSI